MLREQSRQTIYNVCMNEYPDIDIVTTWGPPPDTYNGQPVLYRGTLHHHADRTDLLPGVYFTYPSGSLYTYVENGKYVSMWTQIHGWTDITI